MRMSHLFGKTLRKAPADVELISHQLSVRAGLIRPLGSGMFSILPTGWRVIRKVENIVREEMNAIGGQEMLMPVVHPADIWRRSGRYEIVGPELARFKDRGDRDMVLAMTHEEVVTDLASQEIESYRQLPQVVYHLQTKFRDEPRSRGGLIRVREFTMKDSYSIDADDDGLDKAYQKHWHAYDRIFKRLGLDFIVVGADVGMMGGTASHEFMAFSPNGEDTILICDACGYASNREVAKFGLTLSNEDALELEEIETPNCTTIEAVARYLEIPTSQTAKAVFFKGESGRFIFAVIRGDLEINETKLRNALEESNLTPATEAEIRATGAVPGYASPISVDNAFVVIDESVANSTNLVSGANREGFHARNVNHGRDYEADLVADIAAAEAGFACPECSNELRAERAIEIGNIFKLGTRYSETMGATYLDADGKAHPVVMGCYGIGSGRSAVSVIEQRFDERGIIWPLSIAPYHVSLVAIGSKGDAETFSTADKIYEELESAGVEVLYDDRDERPGVKFNDADLIGNPLRVTVSTRNLDKGQVEVKRRSADEAEFIPLEGAVVTIASMLQQIATEELQAAGLE